MTRGTIAAMAGLLATAGLGCDGDRPLSSMISYMYPDQSTVKDDEIVGADPTSGRTTALLTLPFGGEDLLGVLRFDGKTAYYADQRLETMGRYTGSIRSIGLGGGSPTTLITGLDVIDEIAVDADSIYFSDYYYTGAIDDPSSAVSFIGKAPLAGGSFVKLVDNIPGRADGVAVGGGFVYWSDADAGTVNRISKAGGDSTVLATGQGVVYRLTADDSGVYWVNDGSTFVDCGFPEGSIQSVPTGSSDPVTVVDGIDTPTTVVVSAGTVYYTLDGPTGCNTPSDLPPGGAVVQAPLRGSPAVVLASGLSKPFNLFIGAGVVDYTTMSSDYVTTAHSAPTAIRH
jgi:hypothetical protein